MWSAAHVAEAVAISDDGRSAEWKGQAEVQGMKPSWLRVPTHLHLHSGNFAWEFVVEKRADSQIGIGFMLVWDVGPDWGFFGYLGSSSTAWSYDPSTGDVVTNMKSIQGGLPKLHDGEPGVVRVEVSLPRESDGQAAFVVNGVRSDAISLPADAVVMPAACFLAIGQRVTLRGLEGARPGGPADEAGGATGADPPIVWKVVGQDTFEADSNPEDVGSAFYALAGYCTESHARRCASEALMRQPPGQLADRVFIISSGGRRLDATLDVCGTCGAHDRMNWETAAYRASRKYSGTCTSCGASKIYTAADVKFI